MQDIIAQDGTHQYVVASFNEEEEESKSRYDGDYIPSVPSQPPLHLSGS